MPSCGLSYILVTPLMKGQAWNVWRGTHTTRWPFSSLFFAKHSLTYFLKCHAAYQIFSRYLYSNEYAESCFGPIFEENLMVSKKMSTKSEKLPVRSACTRSLAGVYMTPRQLLHQAEFTPVPSHGSVFVYMISPQNVMSQRHEITSGVEP